MCEGVYFWFRHGRTSFVYTMSVRVDFDTDGVLLLTVINYVDCRNSTDT